MALISYTVAPALDNNGSIVIGSFIYSWAAVTSADTCSAVKMPAYSDKSIQAVVAGGTPTWGISGANDPTGTSFAALHDALTGAAITGVATAGIRPIVDNVASVKPDVPAGAGNVSYYLLVNTMARRG
jgi:hypothetical protein